MSFTQREFKLYQNEIAKYQAAYKAKAYLQAKEHLGRAHIISQKSPMRHLQTHCFMLAFALSPLDRRELLAQLIRIALTLPAHLIGKIPIGNTGWADVPLTKPMPLPSDLKDLF